MFQSHVIDVGGRFVGVAIAYPGKFRFVAVDPRVDELDGSEWRTLPDVHGVVRHLLLTGTVPVHSDVTPRPIPTGTGRRRTEGGMAIQTGRRTG